MKDPQAHIYMLYIHEKHGVITASLIVKKKYLGFWGGFFCYVDWYFMIINQPIVGNVKKINS